MCWKWLSRSRPGQDAVGLLIFRGSETDAVLWGRGWSSLQLLDLVNDDRDNRTVLLLGGFQLFHAFGQVFVAGQDFAQFDEGADAKDIHLCGALAVEHR